MGSEKSINEEERSITFSFLSDTKVRRSFGTEQIDTKNGKILLERIKKAGPLLWNHDDSVLIGSIRDAWMKDGRGYAKAVFSKNQRAEEIFQDVKDGIIQNVSFRYEILDYDVRSDDNGDDLYLLKEISPIEVSLVSCPADYSIGISRKKYGEKINIEQNKENQRMEKSQDQEVKTIQVGEDQIRKHEHERADKIFALADQFDKHDLARQAVRSGTSYEDFKEAILKELGRSSGPVSRASEDRKPLLGLSKREAEGFSLVRAFAAMAEGNLRELAPFEYEVSEEMKKRAGNLGSRSAGGLFVPLDSLVLQRAEPDRMSTKTADVIGGVPDRLLTDRFIDGLYSRLICVAAGAQILGPLDPGEVSIPKMVKSVGGTQAAPTAAAQWLGEDVPAADSKMGIVQISLRPRRISATSIVTNDLLKMSAMPAESLIRNDFQKQIALAIDAATLTGTGTDRPTGIMSTGGVYNATPTTGVGDAKKEAPVAITFNHLVELESYIHDLDAATGPLTYVMDPKTRGVLKTTLESNVGGARFIWQSSGGSSSEGIVNGCRALTTTNVRFGESVGYVLLGAWENVIVGNWGYLEFIVDPYTEATRGNVRVTCHMWADVRLRYPEAFAFRRTALTGSTSGGIVPVP
jgi:HK97 family phage prohead protease